MERYKKKLIGASSSITMDEVLTKSIEELIDQGKRFTIVADEEEEESDDYRE